MIFGSKIITPACCRVFEKRLSSFSPLHSWREEKDKVRSEAKTAANYGELDP
jgi:hypothetical protein